MDGPEPVGVIMRRWWARQGGDVASQGKVWWWQIPTDGEVPDYPPTFLGTVGDADDFAVDCTGTPVLRSGETFVIEPTVEVDPDLYRPGDEL
jgi:hypothetical protein